MELLSLEATDFRNIASATFRPGPAGVTVVTGRNGAGKTSLLEAVAYLATLQSFRGSPREAMVRRGTERAILRAETVADGRGFTIEAELALGGPSRTLLNRQTVRRRSDLHDALRVTVFSPEDIAVVRAGPVDRRRFLDDTLAVVDPKAARTGEDVEKILRQRAALLRSAGGRLQPDTAITLDVWDERLEAAGSQLVDAREHLVAALRPMVEAHYARLADAPIPVGLEYRRSWVGTLADALARARVDDVARSATTLGPHRDELELSIGGLPARTHTSQGEQRSLALALRLAAHQLATERLGVPPVLLLDDVFSELDSHRARALLADLPAGQALLTTAMPPPTAIAAARVVTVEPGGRIAPSAEGPGA